MVTDASQPSVQSITANNLDEAVTRYNSLTVQNISSSTQSDSWQMDDLGPMTFTALNLSNCFATINVNVKRTWLNARQGGLYSSIQNFKK